MKTSKTIVLAIGIILIAGMSTLHAQDIHFSQFWMTPTLQNPALSGVGHDVQASVNYKDQWRSVASPYKTFAASYDMKFNNDNTKSSFFAAGINFFVDKAGDANMGTTLGNLNLAYHISTGAKSTLGAGLMGGFGQRNINYSQLQWMSQYDGIAYNSALPTGEKSVASNFTFADVGAGMAWAYKKGEAYASGNDQVSANAGVAVFHVSQPKYSFYDSGEKLKMKIVAHANVLYGIKNTSTSVVPGFFVAVQGKSTEFMIGSMIRYTTKESSKYTSYVKGSAYSLGLHYRNKDAFIVSALLEMAQYAIGLSYDVNVSGLKTASIGRGGFEISLRYCSPNPFKINSNARF